MSMHLTFRQLQVFTAVAKHQSFTRAAQALYLSQPAVSMQVRQMEEQVGLPLFEQLGRRIYLTEAGREMARYSAAITQQLEEAVQVINDLKGLAGGAYSYQCGHHRGIYRTLSAGGFQ